MPHGSVLDSNEFAVLELLAIKPLTFFPPLPRLIARRLARRGLEHAANCELRPRLAQGQHFGGHGRKVLVSLRSLLRLAMTEGHVNRNAAEPVRLKINKRAEGKLVVGGHPKPGGDSELPARSRWEPVAPASSDGGFHRHAGERAAWPALGQRRVRGR